MSEKAGKESQYSFVPPSSAKAGVGGVAQLFTRYPSCYAISSPYFDG